MKRQKWKNQGLQQANNTVMTMGHPGSSQANAKRNGGATIEDTFKREDLAEKLF